MLRACSCPTFLVGHYITTNDGPGYINIACCHSHGVAYPAIRGHASRRHSTECDLSRSFRARFLYVWFCGILNYETTNTKVVPNYATCALKACLDAICGGGFRGYFALR